MAFKLHRYVISVLLPDRVGILKNITTAITDMGANIDGISQTVVEGYFTVVLTATFGQAQDEDAIQKAIAKTFRKYEASILVRPFQCPSCKERTSKWSRYILTIRGKDSPGILKTLTTYLEQKGINVEDLYFKIQEPNVIHVGELSMPAQLDIEQVQTELQEILGARGLVARLQHENIFRVANEIGSVRQMLKGLNHA